jgi:putative endonuclease
LQDRDVTEAAKVWWLYLLACADGRTYAGIALDVTARFRVHAAGKGSKFTRANRPVCILGAQPFADRSQAQQAEYALKCLEKPEKLDWAQRWPWPGAATD